MEVAMLLREWFFDNRFFYRNPKTYNKGSTFYIGKDTRHIIQCWNGETELSIHYKSDPTIDYWDKIEHLDVRDPECFSKLERRLRYQTYISASK